MKGDRNEETRQNEPFCAFQTFALPTDQPTNRPTDMTSYRNARTQLKTSFIGLCWITLRYHVKLKHGQGQEGGRLECEKYKKVFVIPWKLRVHQKKCVADLGGNVGYAQIAASLASLSD